MCETAILRLKGKPDQYLDGAGELAKAVGLKHSYKLPVFSDRMPDGYKPSYKECLCHVDFRKLADIRGLHYAPPRYDAQNSGEHILSDEVVR